MTMRTMHEVHHVEGCAVAATADIIASKWTPILVHDMSEGPRRFKELEHACPGISPRTLAERLRALEAEGILLRRSYPESPPRVEYELTDKGQALLPIIAAMRDYGHKWLVHSHSGNGLPSGGLAGDGLPGVGAPRRRGRADAAKR